MSAFARAQRLDKVLALVDSDMEGEALTALRKARQMLAKEGLSFEDLARAANGTSGISLKTPFGLVTDSQRHELEIRLCDAERKAEVMKYSLSEQDERLRLWQRKAMELERKLNATASEAKKWQDLARETAERLWDLGAAIECEDSLTRSLPPPRMTPSGGKKHRRKTKVKKARRQKR